MDDFESRLNDLIAGQCEIQDLESLIVESNKAANIATLHEYLAHDKISPAVHQSVVTMIFAHTGASDITGPKPLAGPPPPDEHGEEPATRIRSHDTTRIKTQTRSTSAPQPDDTTRIRTQSRDQTGSEGQRPVSRDEPTEHVSVQPSSLPPTDHLHRSAVPQTDRSGGSSFVPTGSNWANPELWKEHDRGPIEPGSIVKDRFVIESMLGKGGMGTVFKARDNLKIEAQDSDPFVAIKILNKEFAKHPQAMISLQREAKKAQTLAHPNIITVYDFDRDGTTVFMHMELMRGQSLSQLIKANRPGGIEREEALPMIRDMAAGLAYAHENDIVHSDFKPGNVFITAENRVKVLDFGIARASRIQHADRENRAQDEAFDAGDLGAMTPAYASLEMINNEEPHPSDDVYALAVTVYQLLTGRHPFDRQTAAEALAKNLTPRPIKGLRKREWKAITGGLAFKREHRIPDAGTFLRKFHGPRPVTKSIAVLIVVLAVSAAIFAYRSVQPEGPAIPFAELPAQVQLQFTEQIRSGALSLEIGDIDGAWEYYASAWELHPRNAEAIEGLQRIATELVNNASKASTEIERTHALQMIERVVSIPYMADHKGLRQAKKQLDNN